MLSISPIRGDGTYYTSLGRDDYYLKAGEPKGIWLGEGAEILGLHGTVDELTYRRMLGGFSPNGQTALVGNAGTEIRRPGWDLTFSAPKSVSEVWAASHGIPELERGIREAQWAAVQRVVRYLEERAAFGRESLGGHERVPLRLVAAGFEQLTRFTQGVICFLWPKGHRAKRRLGTDFARWPMGQAALIDCSPSLEWH